MKLIYTVNEALPPLAWLAEVRGAQAEILCGRSVERRDSFFVEGSWDAPFAEGNFDTAEWFCGSGARVRPEGLVFSTPTHIISGLYSMPMEGGLRLSNSLYFLLARSGESLDPQYVAYESDFNTVLDGIHHYKQNVHVLGGSEIQIWYFRTLCVSYSGKLTVSVKPAIPSFTDFTDYYRRLSDAIARFADNAADSSRMFPYELVTTISRGYDAPCCAAIARQCGCKTAVTFAAVGKYSEDNGAEIARALGYQHIIERNSMDYRKRSDLVEAEYLCAGELGAQIAFAAFDEDFRGKLVFTGDRGDGVWKYDSPGCNDEFRFDVDGLNHLGASEHRLWVGYISVPMPLYGASTWSSIQAISQSKEMTPWSLKNDYDRPIPRRILEEAGVKRDMFGMSKHGAGFSYRYDWFHRILTKMSPESAASFSSYVRANSRCRLFETVSYFWNIRGIYLNRIGLPARTPSRNKLVKIPNPTTVRYLIPWGAETITARYHAILEKS